MINLLPTLTNLDHRMNKRKWLFILIIIFLSCGRAFNKGVTNKRTLRAKKTPSMKIAEEYDNKGKKKSRKYKNPEKASKARDKETEKVRKRGDKHLKKKRKHLD